jgi:hypothetical protein
MDKLLLHRISFRFAVYERYEHFRTVPSDISEHIGTLAKYAKNCNAIGELGVRNVVSTWAFLQGLINNDQIEKRLTCVDIVNAPLIVPLVQSARNAGINMKFLQADSATCLLQPLDLLFIDTWHIYAHLKRELIQHNAIVKKYIIMHDTESDKIEGESVRNGWDIFQQSIESGYPESEIRQGLQKAIDEFLEDHPEWEIRAKYLNCNGLTVLCKKSN